MNAIRQFATEVGRRRVLATMALYIVAAWATIQVADLAIEANLVGWTLRNVFVASFLGFPVALIIAWFYDITRKGIVKTPPAGAFASFDQSLQKRDYFLFVSLVVIWALANVIVYSPAPVDKSIAILPFENRGHDPQGADLAYGVRLDLQTQLERLKDIKVIAQPSVGSIDKDLPIAVVARELGASFIMKGTVERALDRVRVSVTLIDAKRDEQTWSGSWDRELDLASLFDIRDDIATAITNRLQAVLSPQETERILTRPTGSFSAYQAYLLGKQRMARRATGSLADAIDYFAQAIDLDPDFALAWVGLAESNYLHMLYSHLPEDKWFPKVEAASNKALELNDSLGEAYAISAVVQVMYHNDDAGAELAYKRALELNPNYATAHQWYGAFLSTRGRSEEGLTHRLKALELDPLSANINLVVGNALGDLGRFDEAMAHYDKAIEIDSALPGSYERIAEVHRFVYGQLDAAVVWQRKGIARDLGDLMGPIYLTFTYLDLGDSVQAEHWLNRTQQLAPPEFPFASALMEPLYLHRGEEDKALEFARKTIEWEPTGPYTLANLRNHDLQAGRYAEARARYERGYPALLNADEPAIDDSNYQVAIDLALVLSGTGEKERANLLLERSLVYVLSIPRLGISGYGIADVLIYALQEKPEAALAALRQAIDQGWRTNWWLYLEHDPSLDSVRGEPEFHAMVEEIRADMAGQLEHVRAMEANGELEPIPDIN